MAKSAKKSLQASPQGIKRAEQALVLQKIGTKTCLAAQVEISRSTVQNFFAGKAVGCKNFYDICKKLDLPWEKIADLPEEAEFESEEKERDSDSAITAEQMQEGELLEQLDLDFQSVEWINLGLEIAEKRYRGGKLSKKQQKDFKSLKCQVQSLISINLQLKEVADNARRFLLETQQILDADIERLNGIRSDDAREMTQLAIDKAELENRVEGIEKQIERIKNLKINLEFGKEAAEWLDRNREGLAQRASEAALAEYPEMRNTISSELIDDFYWGIYQYLERISHCLSWGRKNILDEPHELQVLPVNAYKVAFNYVKTRIPERLSNEAKAQFREYINYLIERLDFPRASLQ